MNVTQSAPIITRRSLDQLEDALTSCAQRINASEYELLVLVREFDIRQGWKAWNLNNCAEWLNLKCGITMNTAREKVRVAMGLFNLPLCSEAFADGALSYSKVRALSRVANPLNEEALLDYAIDATASQVEDHCRQLRNVQRRVSTADANRIHNARRLSCSHQGDGSMNISVQLSREAGELVMKAIEIAMAAADDELEPMHRKDLTDIALEYRDDSEDENLDCTGDFFQKQADALVRIAQGFLAGGTDKATSTADHYQVMLHVDGSALFAEEGDESGKSDLPIESVRRITCDASIIPLTEDAQGNPLNVGRKHRVVSASLRRALLGRDRCCRYPGCTHDKWLDGHHVVHWADAGETSLANMMLLCSSHHRLLHEGGYTIHKNFEGAWYFRNGNGKVIPEATGYRSNPSREGFMESGQSVDIDEVCEEMPVYSYG